MSSLPDGEFQGLDGPRGVGRTCRSKIGPIERMGVVVDKNWQDFTIWFFTASAKIAHIGIKFFGMEQLEEAWEWLKE